MLLCIQIEEMHAETVMFFRVVSYEIDKDVQEYIVHIEKKENRKYASKHNNNKTKRERDNCTKKRKQSFTQATSFSFNFIDN